MAWRVALEARKLGPISINVRITAVRKLAVEAADNGLLAPELASGTVNLRPEVDLEQKFLKWISEHEGAKERYMQQTLTKITGGCETFNRVLLNLARSDRIEVRENRLYLTR